MQKCRVLAFALVLSFSVTILSEVYVTQAHATLTEKNGKASPLFEVFPLADPYAVTGYSPDQVRRAYNLPSSGGAGSTIAVVVAYRAPDIASDLSVFSERFGLPEADLEVYSMAPKISFDEGWSLETALDVQWAHAIAPQAKILLVQAESETLNDLLSAVDYARNRPDVVSVSMSWGSDEFVSQTRSNRHFTSAYGAVFYAASGDNGSGCMWPASSANVVSVGGTTLSLDAYGTVLSETAWSKSGGGISAYEPQPDYQAQYGIQSSKRTTPDVSYNADPSTGFAVYHDSRWYIVGGTSAGAPQWAAINALSHSASNDNLYLNAQSQNYTYYFRDILAGSNGYDATTGYDYVTGLGSPLTSNYGRSLLTSITLLPAGQSTPLSESNQFTVTYTSGGNVQTTYIQDSTLTLHTDSNTNLEVAAASTNSNSQEKWVLTASNSPTQIASGTNQTIYYYNLLAQTTSYTITGTNPTQNPTITYYTAPAQASTQGTVQTTQVTLSQITPQTFWALRQTTATATNPLQATQTTRWATQTSQWRITQPNQLPDAIAYTEQYSLEIVGAQENVQWYDRGSTVQVQLLSVSDRASGVGQRVTGYRVDSGAETSVQTAQAVVFPVVMDAPHQIQVSAVEQYELSIPDDFVESIINPPVAGDSGWYDLGTRVTVSFAYSKPALTAQSRINIAAYAINQDSPTALTRQGKGVFTVQITMNEPQTITLNTVTQYRLEVVGGNNITTVPASPTGDDFFDAGTQTAVSTDYLWGEGSTRQNLIGYTLNGVAHEVAQEGSGTYTTPAITIDSSQKLNFDSVTQYLVGFKFTDQNGDTPITPQKVQIETANDGVVPVLGQGFWLDSGTQFRFHSIVWGDVDVKPDLLELYVVDAPVTEEVACQVSSAQLNVKDYLNLPVTDAKATIEFANATVVTAATGSDGSIDLGLIPLGTFNATITYFGVSTTVSSAAQPTTVTIFISTATVILVVTCIIAASVGAVAVLFKRRKRAKAATSYTL
ncbi:MAG: S53 family peptidase [Candidatus Bathyarchaeota archaeon]|nr:S53 family peptidase [Candidatus Bathyarchaeota archaeon]